MIVDIYEATPGPCPVCGFPGGNCPGVHEADHIIEFTPAAVDDPLATFIVPHRVYDTEVIGSRTVRKLKYITGTRIRPEEAKRLGLLG